MFRYEALKVIRRAGVQPQRHRRATSLSAVVQYCQVCISLAHRSGQKQCHGMVEINELFRWSPSLCPALVSPVRQGEDEEGLIAAIKELPICVSFLGLPSQIATNLGAYAVQLYDLIDVQVKSLMGLYQDNIEVLAGPCSFLETGGKNPFSCSCMVLAEFSFFSLLF